jgi:hypothetical protein
MWPLSRARFGTKGTAARRAHCAVRHVPCIQAGHDDVVEGDRMYIGGGIIGLILLILLILLLTGNL